MPLIRAVRGQTVRTEALFEDSDGNPVAGSSPATWVVRDYNNVLVTQGNGVQDLTNSGLWLADVIIPLAAPVSHLLEKYSMIWTLPRASGNDVILIERFEVVPEGDPVRPVNQTDKLLVQGGHFSDTLILPAVPEPGTLSLQVFSVTGEVVYTAGALPTVTHRVINGQYYFDHISNVQQAQFMAGYGGDGFAPYMSLWQYQLPTEGPSFEYHTIYVINHREAAYINDLRRLIDRVNLGDIHPYLAFTDIDLAHYLLRGLDRINGQSPQLTSFTLGNLPLAFKDHLIKAAAVEALRAQYLAEGYLAFDFQGLGVQLNVERTQYISELANMLDSDLQNNLKDTKATYARSGAQAVLSVSMGPQTNFVMPVNPSVTLNYSRFRSVFPFFSYRP
jgi:hypothetical protein